MAHKKMRGLREASMTLQRRSLERGESWVRKSVVVDQRKLDAARRVLGAATEAEAIDAALGLVTFRREFLRGIAAVRRAGGIEDVFEKHQVLIANRGRVVS